jgi:hypothetical protein
MRSGGVGGLWTGRGAWKVFRKETGEGEGRTLGGIEVAESSICIEELNFVGDEHAVWI